MLQSKFFHKTVKDAPGEEASINARLLLRGGFIYKEMAGVWTFLPLGLRVLKKIENIVREEMNKIGGQEMLMSVLQPKSLWEETHRWSDGIGEVMYKIKEEGREIGLGPTHEEMLTDIVRKLVKSYNDLPFYLYQIQTKFRKELRARSGLLRGREFGMKDLYSFHSSREDFEEFYEAVKDSYFEIFKRCGLTPILAKASGAGFTGDYTHEFQVLAKGGEDVVLYCSEGKKKGPFREIHFAQNKEIAKYGPGDKCPVCQKALKEEKSIEVGNIFPLGTKYSEKMKANFFGDDGKKKPFVMGCYGLGISRIMGTVAEVHNDSFGLIWPKEIAPFNVHLLEIGRGKGVIWKKIKGTSEKIYNDLQSRGVEVLYDDRENISSGEKFMEADLIGIPTRMVISEKTLKDNCVEIKERKGSGKTLVKISRWSTRRSCFNGSAGDS